MPMRLDDGWNQIQFNLADFTRRAYGTNYVVSELNYLFSLLVLEWEIWRCGMNCKVCAGYSVYGFHNLGCQENHAHLTTQTFLNKFIEI